MGVDGSLLVIAVYASVSDAKDRARMFAAIVDFLSGYHGDWVLAGDFQTVVCDNAALLQMVADARACEPADSSWHHRMGLLAFKGRACSIIGLDNFPTHCVVVIDVLLGPSCACDVIVALVPLPALKADWQDALARGDLDDVFRCWSTRWEQWLVDLATAEEQHVSRAQRGRGLGSTRFSQAMKRASWQCESLPEEVRVLKHLVAVLTHLMFVARNGRHVEWRTWCRCQRLWDRCHGVGLLDFDFDIGIASLHDCRDAKQGDCAQFHFVQCEDGSATSAPLGQDAIIRKLWDDIYMPPNLL
eukprot:4904669-Amphidinium_carterae.2